MLTDLGRRLRFLLVVVALGLVACGEPQPRGIPVETPQPAATTAVAVDPVSPVNIAHRGASAYAPEHTLAAYALAIEMGADFVEQDLQLTRDGVLICMHDTTLNRTTNVEEVFPDRRVEVELRGERRQVWRVSEFTLAEIKTLDAGAWFSDEFAGTRVPTLQEAIDLVLQTAEAIYAERGDRAKLWGSMVKQTLKRRRPGFNESAYGFRSFNDLLEEAQTRGLLSLELDERYGGYVIGQVSRE